MKKNEKKILIFVQGQDDKLILTAIAKAAQLPIDSRINIQVAGGKNRVKQLAQAAISQAENTITVLFVDADEQFINDANNKYKERALLQGCSEVLFAIPEIESWLFADDILVASYINSDHQKRLKALPLPDSIPYPKAIANYIFPKNLRNGAWFKFLEEMDIVRAAARSPSLKHFLIRIAELLEFPLPQLEQAKPEAANIDLKIVGNLLKSIANKDTIMLKTLDHEYTAADIENSITNGTDLAREYASDLFRVARNLLKHQASLLVKKAQVEL